MGARVVKRDCRFLGSRAVADHGGRLVDRAELLPVGPVLLFLRRDAVDDALSNLLPLRALDLRYGLWIKQYPTDLRRHLGLMHDLYRIAHSYRPPFLGVTIEQAIVCQASQHQVQLPTEVMRILDSAVHTE